jgi:L-amino acid N-acyltransferase YncA
VLGRADRASRSVATVARGIAGLLEMSVELDDRERGRGGGAAFVRSALGMVEVDVPVVAAIAPGNAASLRAFQAAGFQVLGSVQMLRPAQRALRG